jgi:hypothetical protein
MAICRTSLIAALLGIAILAPQASADLPLPDTRTHVDPGEAPATLAAQGDPESPRLTFLDPDNTASALRRGYLYVRARCDARCVIEVTGFTKIGGKQREIAFARQTLPANKVRRIRLKIRADVRRRIAAGARFTFEALPLPVPEV